MLLLRHNLLILHRCSVNKLSPVHTVAEKCDCRRKRRDDGEIRRFCDSVDKLLCTWIWNYAWPVCLLHRHDPLRAGIHK